MYIQFILKSQNIFLLKKKNIIKHNKIYINVKIYFNNNILL